MMRLVEPPSRIFLKRILEKQDNLNLKNFQQTQTPQNEKERSIKEKIPYIPPIVIDNLKNVPQLLQTLSGLTEELVTGRIISSDKLKIFPPTSEIHRKIQSVLKNFSSGDATSLNELCSDHNPVSFEIDINANSPAITKNLKTTNWIKIYDIAKEAIPGNPSTNSTKDIDEAINKITAVILTAINQSSKAKIINDTQRKLPPRITNKITLRNEIKKRWQITYDPRFKRKSTQLTNEIKADIKQYDQDSCTEWLLSLNQEDLSINNATRKFSKKFHKIPPILDTDGLKYTPSEKRKHLSTRLKIPSRQPLSLATIDTSPKLIKLFSISSIAPEMTTISSLPLASKFYNQKDQSRK
ncbi:hypothetical protein AVEN_268125-1 [Araneus ventricosus]|uniref:Uncharacterized protein n=1 Tax=Araneus ventricosus TaxID=182803 RepID=A0A4Y2RNY3_ARAVE|nr:hypothetical protein AVEN_268125-1 [Araneus ventricosus]